MNAKPRLNWSLPLRSGLLAGFVALFIVLVGMIEASLGRAIIYPVLSTGHVLLLLPFVWAGYSAVRKVATLQKGLRRPWLVAAGALAGLLTAAFLVALVLVGNVVNLRAVFINASPAIFRLLTLNLGLGLGSVALLIVGLLLGAVSAGIFLLPSRIRKPLVLGIGAIPIVSIVASALFAQRGLSIVSAIVVFIVAAGGSYGWSLLQPRLKERAASASPKGQRALRWGRWVVPMLIVLLFPLLGKYPSEVLDNVGLYILMGLGLNIVVGFAGLLDLGYVAFFAMGAYTVAILTSPEIAWTGFQLTFWEALPFAVIVATAVGIILGVPVLGMRGDYLAIVTLGFGEIIRIVVLSDWLKPFIGGSNGITRIPRGRIGPLILNTPQLLYYLIIAGCVLAAFVSTRLKDSGLGRAWMALREDEDVAQAMGINLVKTKLLAFATGAAFSGLSGGIFASKLASTYPHSFQLMISINVLCVIIVGGMGSIPGVIAGALALVGLPELLREFSEYRLLVYGAVLVFMMLNRPEGLIPEARRKLELRGEEADSIDPGAEKHITVLG
jgi:branched-chain amino acid transport system permease protein